MRIRNDLLLESAMPDNILELRDLRESFGGVVANDAITFAVPRGTIVGLIGPNGSGKTTVGRLFLGGD